MVREVGRNYGRAVSNSLLGDRHALPVRSVGGIARKRGRVYHNKLDELIKKAEVKTPQGSLSQIQNMNIAFFDLVREAQQDGSINLDELAYLIQIGSDAMIKMGLLEKSIEENGDEKRSAVGREKIAEIEAFFRNVYENMNIPAANNPGTNHFNALSYLAFGGGVLTAMLWLPGVGLAIVVLGFVFYVLKKKKNKKIAEYQRLAMAHRLKKSLYNALFVEHTLGDSDLQYVDPKVHIQ